MAACLLWTADATAATRVRNQTGPACLGVSGDSVTSGAAVNLATCQTTSSQIWQFTSAAELRTLGGERCLTLGATSSATAFAAISQTCTGAPAQKWLVQANGSLKNPATGRCLDAVGGSAVQVRACNGLANQIWIREDGIKPDQTPPSPPSGLRLSGLACRSATLSWAASTDNVEVRTYDIYHDGQLMTSVGRDTRSTSVALVPGARWNLYVNARDAAGNVSQASAPLPVAVPFCTTDTQAPRAPTGLSGSVSGTSATLSWRAATDNVGVVAYNVYRNGHLAGSTAALNYTVSGLPTNTSVRFAVAAKDAQGNVSPLSVGLTLTTGSNCSGVVCSVETAATDSQGIWGLAVLSDGNLIYSRRDALDLWHLNPRTGVRAFLGTLPNAMLSGGEGGMLGVAVTPAFPANDPWLYVYHTTAVDNRIVRLRYVNGALETASLQVLLSGIPRNIYHNGGRLRFGPDGMLYAATGDALNRESAQDLQSLAGKVLRLNPAGGAAPADNPFGNYVWSYGHRNPQGLAFDSQGRLWQQEFGEDFEDETNLVERGGNYGWPLCEGRVSRVGIGCATPGFRAPKATYPPSEASCSGIGIVRDALYVGCLRGARMYRHDISGSSLVNTQQLFVRTYGRVRAVEPSLDGGLWLGTNGFDRILKVNLGR
jgi:glucose/arabinose dehydrogenase